jgi:hypothetical protein
MSAPRWLAALSREMRAMIDGDKANNVSQD